MLDAMLAPMLLSLALQVVTPQRANTIVAIPDLATPDRGNAEINVLDYQLELALTPPATAIQGFASINLLNLKDCRELSLDLHPKLSVSNVRVDGLQTKFSQQQHKLRILPSRRLKAGQEVRLEIQYGGQLAQNYHSHGDAVGLLGDGVGLVAYPEPDGAHTWFPCNDHPSDKAKFSLAVSVPLGNIVGATGVLNSWGMNGGWHRFKWETDKACATYLLSLGAGPFFAITRPGKVPIIDLALPGDQIKVAANLASVVDMVPFLEERFGPYPFERYGHVFTRRWVGGLECQTQTVLGRMAGLGGDQGLLVHELGHQLFGDWVSPGRWQELWLNEGGATYCEWLWEEQRSAKNAKRLLRSWRRSTINLARSKSSHSLANPDPEELFDPELVYNKGGMVLFLLGEYLGRDKFHATLQKWFAEFGGSCAYTDDFEATLSSASEVDLSQFFKQWIYGTDIPQVTASMHRVKSRQKWKTKVTMRQNKKNWFPFASQIKFQSKDKTNSKTLDFKVDEANTVLEVLLDFKPDTFTIDPDAIVPISVIKK